MKRSEIDMCNGPILSRLVVFAVPLMLSGILQLLFNAADVIVVGRYCGSTSMAAVGSNGALINLVINVFMGMSVGVNVLMAHAWGAGDSRRCFRTVHAGMAFSFVLGLAAGALGLTLAPQLLKLMSVPEDVLGLASLYLRIYFLGMPATVVYNFGASILRAIGDTRHPLYFLTAAGALNVVCNLFFVLVCHWDVAGVAAASAISQYLAAVLVVRCLCRKDNDSRLTLRKLKFYRSEILRIVKVGLPAGLTGTVFSLSNMIIQSSVNSFGSAVIAGNVAASNLSDLVYIAMNSFYHAAISFTGQNVGAGKPERLWRITGGSALMAGIIGIILGGLINLFPTFFLSIYNEDPQVIAVGALRLRWVALPYFLCGIMEVGCGVVRGMGKSWLPMIVSTMGSCVFRLVWIYTIFRRDHDLPMLYVSYPISWAVTAAVHYLCAAVLIRRFKAKCAGLHPAGEGL